MKKEEIEQMTEEMKNFVSDVIRKVPKSQNEELEYMVTMATLFHEMARHQNPSAVT